MLHRPAGATSLGGGAHLRKTLILTMLVVLGHSLVTAATLEELRQQVRRTETAFAKTMADRDHAAFASFLAGETVFFGRGVLRGKAAVAEAWKRYYDGPAAPFSWTPESVEVLDSGSLGFSSGPVFDPDGKRIGTFNSVWRREPDGQWRIVFDKGCPPCDCGESRPKP
jgi:ketosteroid isomerase-like protein